MGQGWSPSSNETVRLLRWVVEGAKRGYATRDTELKPRVRSRVAGRECGVGRLAQVSEGGGDRGVAPSRFRHGRREVDPVREAPC